jgi:two-component system sensor histidine kinase KdpD
MARELRRKTPEELLRLVKAEEAATRKGHLKIVLGYASGVGKSFRMLDEARRRRLRGQDVIVGAVQPHVSPEVAALLEQLEVVPLINGGAAIDVKTIIRRHPSVCFIDGLAYNNPPGLSNPTSFHDVKDLMNSAIK